MADKKNFLLQMRPAASVITSWRTVGMAVYLCGNGYTTGYILVPDNGVACCRRRGLEKPADKAVASCWKIHPRNQKRFRGNNNLSLVTDYYEARLLISEGEDRVPSKNISLWKRDLQSLFFDLLKGSWILLDFLFYTDRDNKIHDRFLIIFVVIIVICFL